jgi:hypothetical protein
LSDLLDRARRIAGPRGDALWLVLHRLRQRQPGDEAALADLERIFGPIDPLPEWRRPRRGRVG